MLFTYFLLLSSVNVIIRINIRGIGISRSGVVIRGGFKAESLFGHITRNASSPFPSPPSPHSHPLPSRPLAVGPEIQLGGLGSTV